MTITPDGLRAAALREKEFHPQTVDGKPISAWDRRAETIERTVAEVNRLRAKVETLSSIERKLDELLARPW